MSDTPSPSNESGERRGALASSLPWDERLRQINDLMREMSIQTDPQEMVNIYGERIGQLYVSGGFVSVSRRGLTSPKYKITRASAWEEDIDPWRDGHRLPIYDRGFLGDLIYAGKPTLIRDLRVPDDDPAKPLLEGYGSLLAIPHFDKGEALNMVAVLRKPKDGFELERIPEQVFVSALFGRATANLVLNRQLTEANQSLDREMRVVADIQRSLLPTDLPQVKGLDIAAFYQTSKNAGGDYYDFFDLPGGKLGILIADVSGHGTPAAVLMAILHAIAHLHPGLHEPPSRMLAWVNDQLVRRYTRDGSMFVTALYAVYDPATRRLTYSSAGHNPARLRVGFKGDDGPVLPLDRAQGLPLGILEGAEMHDASIEIDAGDAIVFYTDGITEAFDKDHNMFGEERLDAILSRPHATADALMKDVLAGVEAFIGDRAASDDRTVITVVAQ